MQTLFTKRMAFIFFFLDSNSLFPDDFFHLARFYWHACKLQNLSIFFSSHLVGCGVTTSSSGVKIDIDEDPPYRPTSNLADASRAWWPTGNNNPSIGEVSLGASLSMGSGCILENAGMFFVNLVHIWFLPLTFFNA